MMKFAHFNFNVLDLNRSLGFYEKALGLTVASEKILDGVAKLVYLTDGESPFELELTELFGRTEPYDLGEGEFHLAFVTDQYEAMHARHAEMGCICMENPSVGIYFIEDPDGYWIEIVPAR